MLMNSAKMLKKNGKIKVLRALAHLMPAVDVVVDCPLHVTQKSKNYNKILTYKNLQDNTCLMSKLC